MTLDRWFAAVAARATAPAKWLAIGDSITEGQGASTRAKRWVDLVKTNLRSTYAATDGYNYLPAFYAVYTPDSTWGLIATTTGTVTWDNWAANLGYRHAGMLTGATLVYTVQGTAADLWWLSNGGTFTWKVDAGSATSVNTAGTYHTDNKTRISLGASGSHTITIACTAGNVNFSGIAVFDGDTTSGVHFYDSAHTSFTVANFLADATEFPRAVAAVAPDLVTIELGLNDASSVSVATFQTQLQTLINQLKALPTIPSILLIAAYQPAPSVTAGFLAGWQSYVAAMKTIQAADPTRISVLDLTATMPTATTAGTGLYRTDGLHPNDSGHTAIATAVAPLLLPQPFGVTATPQPDALPPRVLVDLAGLPGTGKTMTVTRTVGGIITTVRGVNRTAVLGTTGGCTDYEAPFGLPITYAVTVYDAVGAVVGTAQATPATLAVDVMWLSDPLAPARATAVRAVKAPESFGTLSYDVEASVVPVNGAELPIALAGTRRAATGIPMTIMCVGAAESGPVRDVLRYAIPFQIRLPVRWQVPLPAMSYGLAQSVQDTLFGGLYGRTHIACSFDLVAPPAATVVVASRTYSTVLVEANTYGDLPGLYATYLALWRGGA